MLPFRQTDDEIIIDDALSGADWLRAVAILVGALLLAIVISRLLRRLIAHGIGPGFAAILTARLVAYSVFLLGLFYSLTTLGVRVGPLVGALGLGGLVLALALQGPVENFVASVILQARRPYTVGDTIDVDDEVGVVADIDARTTALIGLDGRHVRIPNSTVVRSTITNLTRAQYRRSTVVVGVAYETDLQHATEVLQGIFERLPRVLSAPAPSALLSGFGASTIDFQLLYWHRSDVPSELAARHDVVLAVHQALDEAGITIAFPQVVVWTGQETEGALYGQRADPVRSPQSGLEAPSAPRRRGVSSFFGGRVADKDDPAST